MPRPPHNRQDGGDIPRRVRRLMALRNILAPVIVGATGALAAVVAMSRDDTAIAVASACVCLSAGAWLVTVRRCYLLFGEVFGAPNVRTLNIDLTSGEWGGTGRLGPAGAVTSRTATATGLDEEDERAAHRRRIRAVLEAGNSLQVVFQPIVELSTARTVGFEAFSRFADGQSPEKWFAEAHAVGMGVELEMLAVHRAVDHRPPTGYLSVNVSPATLLSDAFLELVGKGAPPDLVVELTEHVGVEDYAELAEPIELVQHAGIRLAVDDAGSGYASMRHVLTLRPDIIKLDRSIVASIDSDSGRQELVRSLTRFAHRTKAILIAEGIENGEEAEMCRRVGVRCGQGYFFGRPGPCPPVAGPRQVVTPSPRGGGTP